MPAVLRRDEATGQNYCHKIGITSAITGGNIVKVISETLDFVETNLNLVSILSAPTNLTVT